MKLPHILAVLATAAIGFLTHVFAFGYFEAEELRKAEGRLSLYRSSVAAELERFSHLPYVLARDTYVQSAAAGGGVTELNARLEGFAAQAGLDAIYLMDAAGDTIAASNHALPESFIGQNYAFRPYFQQALAARQGRFYAIGATTGLPGYFIANAVRSDDGNVQGVVAIKISFADLETSWREGGEEVILANEDGVVLLASDAAWRYRVLDPLPPEKQAAVRNARQFPGQPLDPLDWQPRGDQRARIAGKDRLHLVSAGLPNGWELHYFAGDDRAAARSWLLTAAVVLAAGLALIVAQVQRARRISAALIRAEHEEAQLREANKHLAIEIAERRAAERRLQHTREELERASRLAALGELAASVTHELGQPIAAMRNHVAAAEISGQAPARLTGSLGALVDRMEGITRQLKFFARSEKEAFEDVDLAAAMKAALSLVEPNIERAGILVAWETDGAPLMIRGSKLRMEQVMTNILRNAADAAEGSDAPKIEIRLGKTQADAWFEVRDNGHGLGGATLGQLQEPFATTKESGQGMGLGLAISASIVEDHGGTMTARNATSGGAVFRVTVPLPSGREDEPA